MSTLGPEYTSCKYLASRDRRASMRAGDEGVGRRSGLWGGFDGGRVT